MHCGAYMSQSNRSAHKDLTHMTTEASFLSSLKAGKVAPDQIDDYVDAWHNGAGAGLELHQYLGFANLAEYSDWVRRPRSLEALAPQK